VTPVATSATLPPPLPPPLPLPPSPSLPAIGATTQQSEIDLSDPDSVSYQEVVVRMKRCVELLSLMGGRRTSTTRSEQQRLSEIKRLKANMPALNPYNWDDIESQIAEYPQFGNRKLSIFIWNMYVLYSYEHDAPTRIFMPTCVEAVIQSVNYIFLMSFKSLMSEDLPDCPCEEYFNTWWYKKQIEPHKCGINEKRCEAGYRFTLRISCSPLLEKNYNLATTNPCSYLPSIHLSTVYDLGEKFGFCLVENNHIEVFHFQGT
jgi:hypothetical protein